MIGVKRAIANLSHKLNVRIILLSFLIPFVFFIILFIAAGTINWFWAWMSALVMLTATTLGVILMDYELLEERTGLKKGFVGGDLLIAFFAARLGPLALIIVAGLDFRFNWSGFLPDTYPISGLILLATGYVPWLWSMRVNRFFSSILRIQIESGHHVVSTGPYRYIRHPGYLGYIIYIISLPLVFTSFWAFIPAGVTIIATIIRTGFEDYTLKRQLAGYREYSSKVRYRILPGVW